MQHQERALASSQPGASSKMRQALSGAEQKDLAMREQKTAEWMRQGFGDRNLGVENGMAAGLEQLSRDLQDVQKTLKGADPNGKNQPGGDKNAEALSQVRNLRQMLERAQNERAQRQNYQQEAMSRNGQGQQSQQGGQGQQSGESQNGQNSGNQYSPNGGPGSPMGSTMDGQDLQSAIGQLNSLRSGIGPNDRALRGYLDDTLGSLRLLGADPNRLQSTIGEDAVSRLERLEVELARRAGELQQLDGARLRAPEESPEKYRDAVAEYFKKLSQAKR
jgi:hypothetical protein